MLIDCFPYFNEKELLSLRINYLKDYVDGFIICESNRTHKGEPKPYTCEESLKELNIPSDKVQILNIDLSPLDEVKDPWVRERAQRDALSVGARQLSGDNYFVVSDCDEIPSAVGLFNAVEYLKTNKSGVIWLSLRFLVSRADLQIYHNDKPYNWDQAFVAHSSELTTRSLSEIRAEVNKKTLGYLSDGWHFSWMGDAQRKKIKVTSFAHCHDVIPNAAAPLFSSEMQQHLDRYTPVVGGTDPLGREDHRLHPYPTHLLPASVLSDKIVKQFLLP